MALTPYDSSNNTAVQQELYARKAYLWATKNSFFSQFVGKQAAMVDSRTGKAINAIEKSKGAQSIVTLDDNLKKKRGETVNFHILAPLTGDGVVDDAELTNNEEAMTYYNDEVTVHQRRNAVKVAGMAQQRTFVDCLSDAKELLQLWMAENVIDNDSILALSGLANSAGTLAALAPSTNRHFVGGQTTAGVVTNNTLTLASNDVTNELFGTNLISTIKRKAATAGSGYPKLRPIRYKGKKYYVVLADKLQLKAIKAETAWINANKDGWYRGEDNPIFSGAEGIWDGCLFHECDSIETRLGDATGATSTDPTTYFELGYGAANGILNARALFLGCQALLHASAKNISMVPEKKDYGNKMGISIGMIWAAKKVQFNSEDYGVIAIDTAVVADS